MISFALLTAGNKLNIYLPGLFYFAAGFADMAIVAVILEYL